MKLVSSTGDILFSVFLYSFEMFLKIILQDCIQVSPHFLLSSKFYNFSRWISALGQKGEKIGGFAEAKSGELFCALSIFFNVTVISLNGRSSRFSEFEMLIPLILHKAETTFYIGPLQYKKSHHITFV